MRKVTLGKTGLEVSAVGFGGIPIQRVSEAEAAKAIHRAIDLGVDFIDTAAGYSDSQRKIGAALMARGERVVIATKSGAGSKDRMLADVERARSEMGVDCIDIFQLHGVNDAAKRDRVLAPGGALEGLVEAREKGRIAHIGFTSHSLDLALELVENPAFETIQFPFNLVTSEPKDELIPKARERGLGFIVMKPLCGGQYEDANLAFKFLNGYPDLVPIPGIETPGQIEEIVAVVESGATLEGEEKERAEKAARDLGKLFCRRCGYCMPCPNGVPITFPGVIFDSIVKRLPRESVASGAARVMVEKGPLCTECGECVEKCPYDLPIPELIKEAVEQAKAIIAGNV